VEDASRGRIVLASNEKTRDTGEMTILGVGWKADTTERSEGAITMQHKSVMAA